MKIKVSVIMCSILILILGGVMMVHVGQSKSNNYEVAIAKPETAIKIGKAILNEHFPQKHKYEKIDFEAMENNGVWIVKNSVASPTATENGMSIMVGGVYYVHIRQKDGKVLKIGVND